MSYAAIAQYGPLEFASFGAVPRKLNISIGSPLADTLVINKIEQQHGHIEELLARIEAETSADIRRLMLGYLVRYLDKHFTCKEQLMSAFAYSDLAVHRDAHRDCKRPIERFVVPTGVGEASSLDGLPLVRSWLNGHLSTTDRHLKEWLAKRCGIVKR
jgi:hemerythrin-like metal-binding protein